MSVLSIGVKSDRPGRHQGKAMHIVTVNPDVCFAKEVPRARIIEGADVAASTPSAWDKKDIASDAPYRGKKTFGPGAHMAHINLLAEKYGSFPPDPARPMAYHDYPDDFLQSLIHTNHEQHRDRDIDMIADTKSLFDKNLIGRRVPKMYNPDFVHPFAQQYDPKRDSKGLLGGLTEHSSDASPILHTGKKAHIIAPHTILTPDPTGKQIPGFAGVGIGQITKFERMDQRRQLPRNLDPLGPPGMVTRSYPHDPHNKNAEYDPLRMKAKFNSPGDPVNLPRHVKMIDKGPSEAAAALRGETLESVTDPHWGAMHPTGTKHFQEHLVAEQPGVVPGFSGMGRESREQQRLTGKRLLAPDGVHPSVSRCRSSIF